MIVNRIHQGSAQAHCAGRSFFCGKRDQPVVRRLGQPAGFVDHAEAGKVFPDAGSRPFDDAFLRRPDLEEGLWMLRQPGLFQRVEETPGDGFLTAAANLFDVDADRSAGDQTHPFRLAVRKAEMQRGQIGEERFAMNIDAFLNRDKWQKMLLRQPGQRLV